jgi:FixJ family two-component response regulator
LPKVAVISIVDDDASFRRATANLIDSLGYTVATFSSAQEFLQSDELDHTACLISDVNMPGMSGLELQKRLISGGRNTPIVFVTAYSESKARGRALAAGALDFLSKPFNEDQLIACIDRALAGRTQ